MEAHTGFRTRGHAPGSHDDIANAVAGAAWLASASKSFPAHAFTAEASQAFAATMAQKFPNGDGVVRPTRMVF